MRAYSNLRHDVTSIRTSHGEQQPHGSSPHLPPAQWRVKGRPRRSFVPPTARCHLLDNYACTHFHVMCIFGIHHQIFECVRVRVCVCACVCAHVYYINNVRVCVCEK